MKKTFITFLFVSALFAALASLCADAADSRSGKYTFRHDGAERTYRMHIPDSLAQGAPLVVYVHGYGNRNPHAEDLDAVADSAGFAVCYPFGAFDTKGKPGFNVGYPSQGNMGDECEFFRALKQEVCSRFGLSEENAFLTGMSNGGDICYHLAFRAPGLFRAYGSVAGLLFECTYLHYPLPQPVPFLEIHGNADTVSYWQGDHENAGGWGEYIPVPLAAATMAAVARCSKMTVEKFPRASQPDKMITHTSYTASPWGCDVELYEIDGGKHSWAKHDLPTARIIWDFFSQYVK